MPRVRSGGPRRNMTITMEEDVARWVRVRAAEQDTSVAQLVGDVLKEKMLHDDTYATAMREHFALLKPAVLEKPSGRFPTRDEIHDRTLDRS